MASARERIVERLMERNAAEAAREAAAARVRRQHDIPEAGTSRMGDIAEFLAPQEPWEWPLMLAGPAGRAVPRALRIAGAATGIAGMATEAEGRSKVVDALAAARPYVRDPQRIFAPGIYKDPRVIAREAAEKVAPEHPAMKELFGVTRDDLYEMSERGKRKGNIEPKIWMPEKGKGSYAAEAIMNPANAQRLVDTLTEAEKYPQLTRGMDAWYVMDPMYQRMVQLVGPERARAEYTKFNMVVPPFSAGSDVLTEINRGTAANMMLTRGEYPTFQKFGGVSEKARGEGFPSELRDVKGHAYHGVQAEPVARYIETGQHGYAPDTVKIPLYSQASGVPETGFQTRLPVPDAHFTRAVGMSDVRKNASPGDYMSGAEYRPFGSWYRENVAKPLGIEAVPAQGRMWGTYAPQTGVKTAVGAPKLELFSQRIWERAKDLGMDPATLRDRVLLGREHAVLPILGGGGLGAGAMGEWAAEDRYQ